MLNKTLAYNSKLPKPFQTDLRHMFHNYEEQMSGYMEELRTSQCVLLVAGEMGAGKSSLINLLLGVNIMPTSDLRCTSSLVEISYGQKARALMHYRDDSTGRAKKPKELLCNDLEKFLADFEVCVTKRDEETDESPYEKIQLFWPLELLEKGVTLVDSPGVGDARKLPQFLEGYMQKAFGCLYVIDSTTAIHKHRLGQLLLKAMEANDGFDPNTAMFICNRWDQIPPSDADRVKKSLADRLSMIVPGLKESQLYPISVKNAAVAVAYGQINADHQSLIDGIQQFLPQSMKGKLRFYYRYLSSILKRSLYSLRNSYNIHKEKLEQINKNYMSVESRITVLQKSAKEKLDKMRSEVRRASFDAGTQALQYLDSMHQRAKLSRWPDSECPKKERAWQNVVKNANAAIAERVAVEINNWEKENNFVNKVQEEILRRFKQQFELFDSQLKEVQTLLSVEDMRHLVVESGQKKLMKAQKNSKSSPESFLNIGSVVSNAFALDPKDAEVKTLFREYDRSPSKAMARATEMFLSMMSDASIAGAMSKYFDRFIKGIDRVGNMVPEMMRADQELLASLSKELETGKQKLGAFPAMSRNCNEIGGNLDLFYIKRLMVTDFTADQIQYTKELGRGTFATVHLAHLKSKTGNIQVAVKEPADALRIDDVSDVLMEDAMLRELDHPNIVKYFGVCRKGPDNALKLLFTMEYCPYTLKSKCIDVDNSPSSLKNDPARQKEAISYMTNYLIQICNGLCYVHHKSIVHRDLKPENVLLTERGEVRLADFGLAKKVRDIVTNGIGTPVYMATEVLLLNDKYDTKADIYSLAMIVWELWYGRDLARYAAMEVTGGLKTSIERGWRPSLSMVQSPPKFWVDLITKSWDTDPANRYSADQIGKKLVNYFKELQQ